MPSLYVHNEAFLAIGVEVDFRNVTSPERLERLYPHASAMGCTTLFVPVLWSQVEPVPGRVDFGFLDRQLSLASRHGMKLGLLWFGSNRGGSMCFPDLPGTDGRPAGETVQVPPDVFAFRSFLRHLALADADRTVVLIQVENEVGTPKRADCRSQSGAPAPSARTCMRDPARGRHRVVPRTLPAPRELLAGHLRRRYRVVPPHSAFVRPGQERAARGRGRACRCP